MDINDIQFPYYDESDEFRNKELASFMRVNKWGEDLFEYNKSTKSYTFLQNKYGIRYLWSFFNKVWPNVQCGSKLTPMQFFNNKELFEESLKRVTGLNTMDMVASIPIFRIREAIKRPLDVQFATNFRPSSAMCIYDIFLDGVGYKEGAVWDPCSGFGGRMLGAVKSERVGKYIGCEPATLTFEGLSNVRKHIVSMNYLNGTNITLLNTPMENIREFYDLKPESLDLVFTSPPYFNQEKYSNEDTQSFKTYPEYDQWLNGFMTTMVKLAYQGLKPNRKFILNIAGIREHQDLALASLNIALENGFKLIAVHQYMIGSKQIARSNCKFEPIFELEKSS